MIRRIDHIGVAVNSLEDSLPFWADTLGLDVDGIETLESEQVKVAFLEVGGSRIELLEPTSEDSVIGRYLGRRGQGVHHVTLEVQDLEARLESLRQSGVRIVGDAPRSGAGGRQVAFLHPGGTSGVLLELIQARESKRSATELAPGATVLLYLREPQEKLWGVLRKMDANGVVLEGIDLGSFDGWLAQLEREETSVVGPSVLFVPMMRLEKMLLDQSSGELPSLAERFERRIGRTVLEVLGE